MPCIVGNNGPLHREPVGQDEGRPEAAEAHPGPVRPARNAADVQTLQLKLSDLRLHADEADNALTAVPERRQRLIDPLQPAVDEQSAHLAGRAYLEFLSTDVRLGVGFQMFIDDRWVLGDPD